MAERHTLEQDTKKPGAGPGSMLALFPRSGEDTPPVTEERQRGWQRNASPLANLRTFVGKREGSAPQ
jgi:hypothetical protein